jgi:hypothetical protein
VIKIDEILDKEILVVLNYLRRKELRPGGWVTQVNLHHPGKVEVHAVTTERGVDPLDHLVELGKILGMSKKLLGVAVIAESVDDIILISCADLAGNANIAYLDFSDAWHLKSKHYSHRFDASKLMQHPAAAVVRGMTSGNYPVGGV